MKYELPQIIILTDKELMETLSIASVNMGPGLDSGRCTSCGFHVF